MQSNPSLPRRLALVAGLAMISASCHLDDYPHDDDPGPPATLVELTGETAAVLQATFEPAAPVLVTRAGEKVQAIVFSEDPGELERLLKELIVDEVPGCVAEGAVECCDLKAKTFVLSTEVGWLRTGENCQSNEIIEGNTAADDPDEPVAPFVKVDPEITRILNQLSGVDYPFMQLAERDGGPRALVNAEFEMAGRVTPSDRLAQTHGNPDIIPAVHRRDPPPGFCVSSLKYCMKNNGSRCRKGWRHKYLKRSGNKWCEQAPECRCR